MPRVDKDFVAKSVSTPNEEPVLFQERVHATKPEESVKKRLRNFH
jgi:hypothetical protein